MARRRCGCTLLPIIYSCYNLLITQSIVGVEIESEALLCLKRDRYISMSIHYQTPRGQRSYTGTFQYQLTTEGEANNSLL